ncbi:replication endonuclease [Marisediminitalea sp.]|uniref:replication endonuclease n=1 Tax=Marisediminitalea sp. TaxID=2662268 RepID=UPI0035166449
MMNVHENLLASSLNELDHKWGKFMRSLSRENAHFLREQIYDFPREIQHVLIEQYSTFKSDFDANTNLRKVTERLNSLFTPLTLSHFDANEDTLRTLADKYAEKCRHIEIRENPLTKITTTQEPINELPSSVNGQNSVNGISQHVKEQMVFNYCTDFVNDKGIKPPLLNTKTKMGGAIKRMQCKYWWLKQLRRLINRKREQAMLILGKVNSHNGKYCSDLTLTNRTSYKLQQISMMDSILVVNEDGESFTLKEIYDLNISNPVNRRNELMTRIAGLEKLAIAAKHDALFVTITCPSKYHNSFAKSGMRNPKWNGSTPYDAQQYLNGVWSRIRSKLDKQKIQQYGFRIAEPQHDGTPHWHLLLFISPAHTEKFKEVFSEYALQEDGNEAGAKENRCDFVTIDHSRGSAAGYIAKYVSKNIDGGNLDTDIDGGSASSAAKRVEAWASCWGIRQFQQIGGVAITPWRELRKLKFVASDNNELENIRIAADKGDFAAYVSLMGGVFSKRNEQTVRPLYKEELNKITGLLKKSWYDGLVTKKLKGIVHKGQEIITRLASWQLIYCGKAAAL